MLGVADKERRDTIPVHDLEEFVNVWVKDGFADQTQGAVTNAHGFAETLGSNSRDALHHLDLLVVRCCDAVEYHVGGIGYPAPRGANRVGTMSPAEYAFITAGQGWCGFHAEM